MEFLKSIVTNVKGIAVNQGACALVWYQKEPSSGVFVWIFVLIRPVEMRTIKQKQDANNQKRMYRGREEANVSNESSRGRRALRWKRGGEYKEELNLI